MVGAALWIATCMAVSSVLVTAMQKPGERRDPAPEGGWRMAILVIEMIMVAIYGIALVQYLGG